MESIKYKNINNGRCCLSSSNTTILSDSSTVSKSAKSRAVSFAPPSANEVYDVPHINDYSSEIMDAIWYNEVDYERVQTSCAKIIRKMNSDKCRMPAAAGAGAGASAIESSSMKKNYCPRGLERFTDAGVLACRTIRDNAIEAVLDEQLKQWKNEVLDPARIADIYAQRCLDCKIDAIITALRDELELMHVVVRSNKKIDDASIINSQKDNNRKVVHYAAPLVPSTTTKRLGGGEVDLSLKDFALLAL
jgi:hypothetical protein